MSGGGVKLNMIPKDGGNRFNGSVFGGYQSKNFQTDNLTDALKARGLKSADGIDKLSNVEASFGGPIKKDRVWFFLSARTFHLDTLANGDLRAFFLNGVPSQAEILNTARGTPRRRAVSSARWWIPGSTSPRSRSRSSRRRPNSATASISSI